MFVSSTLKELAVLISKSTCQLLNFKPGTKQFPIPNGCSVLFEFNNRFYCISNAHVVANDNYGKTFFLIGQGKTSNIGGLHYFSKPALGNSPNQDSYDISVVLLSNETVQLMKDRGYIFMNFENIKTGHNIESSDRLFFVGYPASKTKIDVKKKRVISRPFFFLTHPVNKDFKKINFPKEFHVIAKYSRSKVKDILSVLRIGPSPRGMSGSGIWLVTSQQGNFVAQLIGIFSEYHENRSLLIGSKIDLYIDIIKQLIDPSIPNKGIKINVTK